MDIISLIESQYDTLSRVQKRIADYIRAHADEACFLSLKQFSQTVNATEVTVVAFTHKIGLKSFVEMKKALQKHIRTCLTPSDKIAAVLGKNNSGIDIGNFIANEKQAVEQTYNQLSFQEVQAAAGLLEAASRVYVVGFDISTPVADFLVLRLRYLGLDVVPLNLGDYSHMMLEVSRAGQNAVFALVSFPIHADRMVAFSRLLCQEGRSFFTITNEPASPVAQGAKAVLVCETEDVVFFNSITAAVSMVNLLSTRYASAHQDALLSTRRDVAKMVEAMKRLSPGEETK